MQRLFGIETEYGITIDGIEEIDTVAESIELIKNYRYDYEFNLTPSPSPHLTHKEEGAEVRPSSDTSGRAPPRAPIQPAALKFRFCAACSFVKRAISALL